MSYWVKESFDTLDSIPTMAGVYAVYNETGVVVYIGSGSNLRERIRAHRVLWPGSCFVKYRPTLTVAGWLSSQLKLTARLRPTTNKGRYTWKQLRELGKEVVPSNKARRTSDGRHKHRTLYPASLEALLQLKEKDLTYPLIASALNFKNLRDRNGRCWTGSAVKQVYKNLPASVDIHYYN